MRISYAALLICLILPDFLAPAQSQATTNLITSATNVSPTTTTVATLTSTPTTPGIKTLTTTIHRPITEPTTTLAIMATNTTAATATSTITTRSTSASTTTSTTSAKTTDYTLICNNGGTLSISGDTCLCPPGYGGKTCEELLKVCQNGGTWDGIKCICTTQSYGELCQYVLDEFEVGTVLAEVEVGVTVINRGFNPQLSNNASEEYKMFERNFKSEMVNVYRLVPGFKDIEILSIRAGSIIVDHKVIMELELKANISIQEDYKGAVTILKEELKVFIQSQPSCNHSNPDTICLSNSTSVREVRPPTESELCQRMAPENYSNFYFPYFFGGSSMSCVTHCTTSVPGAINCNYGVCRLLTTGPRCFCPDLDTYWYEGDNCSSRINKIAVFGGFGAALGVLLIVIITLAILLQKSKKHYQQRNKEESKQNLYSDINGD